MTDCIGVFCKQLSIGFCNEQLAIGNLQLANSLTKKSGIILIFKGLESDS